MNTMFACACVCDCLPLPCMPPSMHPFMHPSFPNSTNYFEFMWTR